MKQTAGVDIVNENMYGALRLVSVEKGYDPRDFALIGFGGAGPLHANALGKALLAHGQLSFLQVQGYYAYGDVSTNIQDESSMSFIRRFSHTDKTEVVKIFEDLAKKASKTLDAEGVSKSKRTTSYQVILDISVKV